MTTNYVLLDYENVQCADLKTDLNKPFKLWLFVGKQQMKIPFSLAAAMQELGENAEYIKVKQVGSNALDFYITYYLGRLICQAPTACFYIISKDKGYDPLIAHLRSLKFKVQRRDALFKPKAIIADKTPVTNDAQIEKIVMILQAMKNHKPNKIKSLHNTVNHKLKTAYDDQAFAKILNKMQQAELLKIDNNKIIYNISIF